MLSTSPQKINPNTYNAHSKQSAFHHAVRKHDYVLFNGGRGSGKSTAGAIQSILEAWQYQPQSAGVVIAPTYPMLEDASMKEFFHWLPRAMIADWHKQRRVLTLTNGSEIAFRSAEHPDSLRGPNRTWAWLDEPRNIKTREVFDIVSAQLRPTRKCWLTTTPAGIFHWMYDLFVEHPLPNSKWIHVRTRENPYVPDEYERTLRMQYTGLFASQELDAEWVSFEGRIYDNFDLAENVSESAEYNPDLSVMWGVDDGYAQGQGIGTVGYHPRVVLLAQLTAIGGLNIFNEYVAASQLSETTINTLIGSEDGTQAGWPYRAPDVAYVDSSAAELKARIWERGITTVGATHPVSEGIKNLRRLICDGNGVRLIKIHPRCTNLIRELQLYRYDDASKVANVGEPKPLKLDDHGPDAARYLAWPLRYNN